MPPKDASVNRLTVVIVNYNSADFLESCVESVFRETRTVGVKVVIVDNASRDRDFSRIRIRFPELRFILNTQNRGFAAACNQGIHLEPAHFYLLLNPDTRVLEGAIDRTLEFLETHPEAGIAGCRVENSDGSLQMASRRSIPRPSSALYRFLGLSRVFPRSPTFARYNLTYLDESTTHEVEAVSGSYLMLRHAVFAEVGGLDESFFLYGEDLDLCFRALQNGWKNYYFAGARILHYKRRSSSRDHRASAYHYYQAMEIFYRKHFHKEASTFKNLAVLLGIRLLYARERLLHALGRGSVGSKS